MARKRKTPEELAEQRRRMSAAYDERVRSALSISDSPSPEVSAPSNPLTVGSRGSSDLSKYNFPTPDQLSPIGPLTIRELKSPVSSIGIGQSPYVSRSGGTVTFTATGPKTGRGRVPNDVLARYRKAINQAKGNGQPPPYLEYNGERFYYQSRGKSLVSLGTKLDVVEAKTQREISKTPTLDDYVAVFGDKEGPVQYDFEQKRLKAIKANTPTGFSRGHIRPDVQGGMWHSRNLKLEKGTREDGTGNYQKRSAPNSPEAERLLNLHASTPQEHIALQGPNPTPRQRQQILSAKPNQSINALRISRNLLPLAASLPLSATVFGQSAHAAYKDPTANNIEDAAWDGAGLVADIASAIPVPLVMAAGETAQKGLNIAHAARMGQRAYTQSQQKPQPKPQPVVTKPPAAQVAKPAVGDPKIQSKVQNAYNGLLKIAKDPLNELNYRLGQVLKIGR